VVRRGRGTLALAGVAALALVMSACGGNDNENPSEGGSASGAANVAGDPYILGTTDTVTALDPAGSYDLGSTTLEYNLYQTLMTVPAQSTKIVGDAAKSCKYDNPKTLTCTLNPGLTFSNGDPLTSSDVKYSFERAIKIQDPLGAAIYLLGSITHTSKNGTVTLDPGAIETPNDTTVVFHLNRPDTTFQYVLTYPGAAAIVDEDVFPADKKLADDQVIGSGPYKLSQYKPGEQAVLEINDSYQGENKGVAPQVFVQYYKEPSALKLAVENGEIDIAWRSLSSTDINDLKGNSDVTVATGRGAEIRYWVMNADQGVTKDPAVRQAVAQVIDRDAIDKNAYDGTVEPLYSIVPPGYAGQTDSFKAAYGAPNTAKAKKLLKDAGISTPVDLTMGYTPTHYGSQTVDEATELKRQLEASGLFKVDLKSTEWEQYQTISKEGAYDIWNLGWFPDYPDTDDYLSPFMVDGGFFENGYSNPQVNTLIAHEEATNDQSVRQKDFVKLQNIAARDVPFVPSWVGPNIGVYGAGIKGVEKTLDPSFIFRFWLVTKNA
jgi:peptide/nickel transport system substrate-binding protein